MTFTSLFHTILVRPVVKIYSVTKQFLFLTILVSSLALNFITLSSSSLAVGLADIFEPMTGTVKSNATLERENKRLKTVVRNSEKQLTLASASLSRAASDIRYRDEQIIAKSLALSKATDSLKTYQAKISRIKGALPRMRSTIVRTASTNASSIVAESIPFWGSAVVVAATTLEIRELCTLMTELDSVERALAVRDVAQDESNKVCGIQVLTLEEVEDIISNSPQAGWEIAREYFPQLPEWNSAKKQ